MAENHTTIPHRFQVSLSFSGPHREKIREIAEAVSDAVDPGIKDRSKGRVFFDEWFPHEIYGPDMDTLLQSIYLEKSLMVVAEVSSDYADRPWPQAEARAIRGLRMRIDSAQDQGERLRLLSIRLADGDVPGVLPTEGVFDGSKETSAKCARVILERLQLLRERLAMRPLPSIRMPRTVTRKRLLAAILLASLLSAAMFVGITNYRKPPPKHLPSIDATCVIDSVSNGMVACHFDLVNHGPDAFQLVYRILGKDVSLVSWLGPGPPKTGLASNNTWSTLEFLAPLSTNEAFFAELIIFYSYSSSGVGNEIQQLFCFAEVRALLKPERRLSPVPPEEESNTNFAYDLSLRDATKALGVSRGWISMEFYETNSVSIYGGLRFVCIDPTNRTVLTGTVNGKGGYNILQLPVIPNWRKWHTFSIIWSEKDAFLAVDSKITNAPVRNPYPTTNTLTEAESADLGTALTNALRALTNGAATAPDYLLTRWRGLSFEMPLLLREPIPGRDNYILDIGNNLERNRLSLFIDTNQSLCFRAMDQNAVAFSVKVEPSHGTFEFGHFAYISFEFGTSPGFSFIRLSVNGQKGAELTQQKPIDIDIPFGAPEAYGVPFRMGADLAKQNGCPFLAGC